MRKREPKYAKDDKVKIVNYGHLHWVTRAEYKHYNQERCKILKEKDGLLTIDINPEYVGEEGIIDGISMTQGVPKYSIIGTTAHAWFDETQLKLILKV